ncbi:truncated hemoglobin [Mycolicibacterium chubuense NBB4]|uniref:Truncated hemoglobin n=1 Tax=Mycolicibacterium chubuense (strain NBB4) TaxID=710421 RepID=I4BGR7_MYCCN|nr:group III truncated hemoglobin [Mycolicibacterium chubuense]AFM16474.1 truncated hemoglobin [Mycolicibacterium chubuense NBB4]
MADSGSSAAGLRDVATRADIDVLLRRFYHEAFGDQVLAAPFAELASHGLEQHLPVMCDFWETVLFRAGLYRRNALTVHRGIHESTPLSAVHFTRWLALWTATVDQMYQGPVAEHAKIQAGRIATAMHRRLTGAHHPGWSHRSVRAAVKEDSCAS